MSKRGNVSAENDNATLSDSRDYEGEFYTILSGHEGWEWPKVKDVQRDIFDASLGDQVGITGDGNVAILLTCSQRGAVLLAGAIDHWVEHGCQESVQLAMYILARIGQRMKGLLPSLSDVDGYTPFTH